MIQNGEVIYSAEQIRIPPELPEIIKNYTKHILKTQPADILAASAEYFQQISKAGGDVSNKQPLTSSQLDALYRQLLGKSSATRDEIVEACKYSAVPEKTYEDCFALGGWGADIPTMKFWALAVATTTTNFESTIKRCCDIIAGGKKDIPASIVDDIVSYLAERDPTVGNEVVEKVKSLSSGKETVDVAQLLAVIQKGVN